MPTKKERTITAIKELIHHYDNGEFNGFSSLEKCPLCKVHLKVRDNIALSRRSYSCGKCPQTYSSEEFNY